MCRGYSRRARLRGEVTGRVGALGGRRQGEVRRAGRAAVVVRDGLDQLQRRGVVGVRDRAGHGAAERNGDRGAGLGPATDADPCAGGIAGGPVFEVKSRVASEPSEVADRVKSAGPAVPPLLFVTVLTSFSVGVSSVFVIVQVTAPPSGTEILFGLTNVPVSQLQTPVEL